MTRVVKPDAWHFCPGRKPTKPIAVRLRPDGPPQRVNYDEIFYPLVCGPSSQPFAPLDGSKGTKSQYEIWVERQGSRAPRRLRRAHDDGARDDGPRTTNGNG